MVDRDDCRLAASKIRAGSPNLPLVVKLTIPIWPDEMVTCSRCGQLVIMKQEWVVYGGEFPEDILVGRCSNHVIYWATWDPPF